jgi:hypothetical protein
MTTTIAVLFALILVAALLTLGAYIGVCYGIAKLLPVSFNIAQFLRTDTTPKVPKQLKPGRLENVGAFAGSVGTAEVAFVAPAALCRGCGLAAWQHDSEEEFQRCNRRANNMNVKGEK